MQLIEFNVIYGLPVWIPALLNDDQCYQRKKGLYAYSS